MITSQGPASKNDCQNSEGSLARIRRVGYLPAGLGCVALGVLGVVLPGLPATPFLLLASYLLARSSPRLNEALLRWRLVGPLLRDWQLRGGVDPVVRVRATIVVLLVVATTLYFSGLPTPWRLGVAAIALVGILVIWRLPDAR
ncbi:MAG: DUF454 family protein [Planctomycetales bacterium]|nr:DUF454 family protein [Planctomycetales bacterium]NIM09493.1 DUF454 family protein [Planctomycetales bacterium]NIN08982.1 DUF454 family protein [Planctomycetales bacterium]NIN78097.1 DUF454 family protein [Planctomycetales bacterium]NIO35276.1 DUF454 family protein [Planctomycetales bacterium]